MPEIARKHPCSRFHPNDRKPAGLKKEQIKPADKRNRFGTIPIRQEGESAGNRRKNALAPASSLPTPRIRQRHRRWYCFSTTTRPLATVCTCTLHFHCTRDDRQSRNQPQRSVQPSGIRLPDGVRVHPVIAGIRACPLSTEIFSGEPNTPF